MRNDLLSIGEVSKLKGVSVKALRYYERIGVFTPAHVDAHSGYRYYSLNQLFDLDVILTCADLGIPLKELLDYRTEDGSLDLSRLLERSRAIALDNIRRAESTLRQIDSGLEEIHIQERLRHCHGPYRRSWPDLNVITAPWNEDGFTATTYIKAMTELYAAAEASGATPLFFQGMLLDFDGGEMVCRPYVEVDRIVASNTMRLPGGIFEGIRIEGSSPTTCFNSAFDYVRQRPGSYCITEVWDAKLPNDSYVVEIVRRIED